MATFTDNHNPIATNTGKNGFPQYTTNVKNAHIYNNPHWGVSSGNLAQLDQSSIGEQLSLNVIMKQALIELEKERYFTQMSKVYRIPKHNGKVVKKNHYMPVLDDRNVSSQGIDATGQVQTAAGSGNLYGSTKDIGKIMGKLPTLTEVGGRVNRIGFTRTTLEATAFRLGFFYEWTQEAMDFDSDAALLSHMGREAMRAAHEIQEDMIAIDLLKQCPNVIFTGSATGLATMGADAGAVSSVVTYDDLERLELMLRENRAPGRLSASKGSTKIDTHIIGSGYALYVGYPLLRQLRKMHDTFGLQAFIPVEKYAAGANTLRGEIGSIAGFRIILVPEMPELQAAGKELAADSEGLKKYRSSKGYAGNKNNTSNVTTNKDYADVFPMLAVASEAFTCLGFTGGYGGIGDFMMKTQMPGQITADDPYGETGRTSIKWSYGMLIERPEWIATIYTLAEK